MKGTARATERKAITRRREPATAATTRHVGTDGERAAVPEPRTWWPRRQPNQVQIEIEQSRSPQSASSKGPSPHPRPPGPSLVTSAPSGRTRTDPARQAQPGLRRWLAPSGPHAAPWFAAPTAEKLHGAASPRVARGRPQDGARNVGGRSSALLRHRPERRKV